MNLSHCSMILYLCVLPFVHGGQQFLSAMANALLMAANETTEVKVPLNIIVSPDAKQEILRDIVGYVKVTTTSGILFGSILSESYAFFSVPFGKAPINDLRFQPPEPFISTTVLDKTVPDHVECYQLSPQCSSEDKCDKNYSEDCLVLNVHVPRTIDLSKPPTERLPVMVWIHGGAFFSGSGTSPIYDARWLTESTNTIIVNINYRLDALGFLNYEENGESIDGNQGFKDQQLALQWVQDNIETFGGDKNIVTIFGESAGAQSVMLHLVSEKSDPLFKRAIMQSNPAAYYYPTKAEAESKTQALLKAINCVGSGMKCLKDASALSLMKAHGKVMISSTFNFLNVIEPYRPILDGVDFIRQPFELIELGEWQSHKEVIIGTLSEEVGFINVVFEHFPITSFLFKKLTEFVVGSEYAEKVVEEYKKLVPSDANLWFDYTDILSQEISDYIFVCPTRALARFFSSTAQNTENPHTHLYLDSHPFGGLNCEQISPLCGYSFHGSDIFYTFNTGQNIGLIFGKNDTAVAKMFSDFWGYFAYFGKPSKDMTEWPIYTLNQMSADNIYPWTNVRIEAPQSFTEDEYRKELCDFWDSLNIYTKMESNPASEAEQSTSDQLRRFDEL